MVLFSLADEAYPELCVDRSSNFDKNDSPATRGYRAKPCLGRQSG